MTTQQVADRLVELCRKGEYEKAQRELFADNAVSIEEMASPVFEKETKGLKAIIEKGHKFQEMVETIHGGSVSEPIVAGNSIAFKLSLDATMKGKGRSEMTEICVYKVKDGKIASELFVM
ncbi:MAG: nuclear transport factor 2 family protein [Bacteroidota bacterium]|nr:nuclear transport factor 2 family protein [Bacteroidota bacterium]MDP4215834.1 nuclear transport factor 2 family protein [Bacteroidota bacterium]MDP4246565.1 nuclear transport factor 2 family protein [Bacteroidota bacterium]MDP4255750.1 nuclear transport factor 2 family protein [Bacteroidota bacterium]MDP4260430.1 nuclear transport factor 2 family protein [Bacteroidota bacterium]